MNAKYCTASRNPSLLVLQSLLVFLFVILQPNPTIAQEWQDLHISHYTSKNGLPQNSVKSMLMDKNRFLWMATESGLVRFDGYDFERFTPSNTIGFTNERLSAIKSTVSGDIFVEDVDGNIVAINNSRLKSAHKVQKPRLSGYWMRGGFPDINFIINADLQNIKGITSNHESMLNWYHVIPIDSDRFMISTSDGLFLYSKKRSEIVERVQTGGFPIEATFQLNGSIYIMDSVGNCRLFNKDTRSFRSVQTKGLNGKAIVHEKLIWNFEKDQCFLISDNELYRIENNENGDITANPVTNQIPTNCLISEVIYDQKSASYFVGTTTKGLYIFRKRSIRTILSNAPDDVHANCFYSQFEIGENHLYVGNETEIRDGRAIESTHKLGVGPGQFYFSIKHQNKIYYSISGYLQSYDLNTKTQKTISSAQRGYFAAYASGDSVYLASTSGLHYIQNDSLHLLARTGLTGFDQRITTITKGPDEKLWMASCVGILCYDTKTKQITRLPEMEKKCVRTIKQIEDLVMIGTYGQGFYVYQKGKAKHIPADPLNKLEKTHSFHLDRNGLLWMSTNTGLVNTPMKDVRNHLKDSTQQLYYYYYDNQDGIINTEFNGGCYPTHLEMRNGYVSYPTMEGMALLVPENAVRDLPNELIFLDEAYINGERVHPGNKIHLKSRKDEVVIHLSTPYWGNLGNLQLEYRIVGFNDKWKRTEGGGRWIDFVNLPHGKYTLEVRNMVSSNPDDASALRIPVEIEPEFYETWGFLLGGIFSGIIVLFGLFKLNNARILRQNEVLEEQVLVRTHELESTNQSLNSAVKNLQDKEYKLRESIRIKDKLISIISHDIITPIKFLSIVSNVSSKTSESRTVDPKESEENMKYIGAAAEKIYNNAANILNWIKLQNELIRIEPENIGLYDFVDEVIAPLESVIDKDAIQMINDVPEEEIIFADPNILKIILQNILSNAVKYTKSGTIRVLAEQDEHGHTTITVTDTGMGMPVKIIDKINTIKKQIVKGEFDADDPDTGNQLGYFIIFDFARLIHGDVEIQSELGKGTVVKLMYPPPRELR